jgi:hypothetical protein
MNMDDEHASLGSPSTGRVAAACVLALGLGIGSFLMSQALEVGLGRFHAPHTVSVKGLSERQVKADLALWPLRFVETNNDLSAAQAKIEVDLKTVVDFLKAQGLNDNEIAVGRMDVVDLMARQYRNQTTGDNRFILYANVMILSTNVDLVQALSRKISDLVKSGVIFTVEGARQGEDGTPASLSPYYLFTKLNDVKLEMLAEATRNARAAAVQFAHDADVPLGGLVQANQGVFSILPGDRLPGASETAQINKIVRVVSTVEFALAN